MGTVVRKKELSLSTCSLYVSHYDNSLVEQILSSNLQMRKKMLRDLMNMLKAVLKVKEMQVEPQVLDTIWH